MPYCINIPVACDRVFIFIYVWVQDTRDLEDIYEGT
jgi:hypothetical protein